MKYGRYAMLVALVTASSLLVVNLVKSAVHAKRRKNRLKNSLCVITVEDLN